MSGIFNGLKVLDFTNNAAGPLTCSLLADYGADVVKIERPVVGDDVRGFAPRLEGESLPFLWLNRGKRSVEIALDDPEGVEMVKTLIKGADVVVEAFKPGVMKKFGLDYEHVAAIKPDIVYCSISAFGQTGPYSKKPGYDLIAQALSGLMDITGDPDGDPVKHGSILGDYVGAINAFGCISAALYHRKNTGEGQYIDVSLCDGLVALNNCVEPSFVAKKPMTRIGNHSFSLCPYGVYPGKNGQSMIICAPANKLWFKLCDMMGKPELGQELNTAALRIANLDKIISEVQQWASQYDDIADAVKILDEAGIPSCKVQKTAEVIQDEHFRSRGSICNMPVTASLRSHGIETIPARGPWVQFSKTPAVYRGAPVLGDGNFEVLEGCGYSREHIESLEKKWAEQAAAKK